MLINTTSDLRNYLPASVTLEFDDIKPKIRLAERETIIPLFSQSVYDLINVETVPSGELTQLHELCAEAVAHLALLHYLDFGQVHLNSSGIQIASTDNMKTAFEWQIDQLKEQCSLQGWSAIESALKFLETAEESTLKAAWEASDTFAAQAQMLLPTLKTFETYAHLGHSRVLFNKLSPMILALQEDIIEPAIGTALLTVVFTPTANPSAERTAALAQVKKLASKALAYFTIGSGFQDTMLILSDNGPLIINGMQSRLAKAKQTAPEELVMAIAQSYQNRAQGALAELLEYCQKHVDLLPEYEESENYISDEDQTNQIPRNDPDWGMVFF